MNRGFWNTIALIFLLFLVSHAFAREGYLKGEQITTQMAKSAITGTNQFGSDYTYHIGSNGAMTGIAEHQFGVYYDVGRWWVKDDYWCRQWELWDSAKVRCQRVFITNREIELIDEDGTPQENGEISREEK